MIDIPALDSQLVDAITSLEALVGISAELRFRIAFRVAGLLAESHAERAALLQSMKDFYDTRSAVVHGGRLNAKQRGHLEHLRRATRNRETAAEVVCGLFRE
jgi:hypothetical protein